MIKYSEIINFSELSDIWNQELGFIFPITNKLLDQNIIDYPNKFVLGAFASDQLVGFVVAKRNITDIPSYENLGWISIIFVSKAYRNQGIGSKLLSEAEHYLHDVDTINVGKDINNFFPGVPIDFNGLTDKFFQNRGYIDMGITHDLINTKPKQMMIRNKEFKYMICTLDQKDAFQTFMRNNFPGGWDYQLNHYFSIGGDGSEYVICLDKDKVIGFARFNDKKFKLIHYNITWYDRFNNLGGIGPLGVDRNYRGKDIGYDVVAYGINTLIERGISEIIIDPNETLTY